MKKTILFIAVLSLLFTTKAEAQNSMTLDFNSAKTTINKNIYGQFAEHLGRCIYDGIWVGPQSAIPNVNGYRKDVLEALQELDIPVLRWPGGCFADTYHWKDGVGPVAERPNIKNVFWGGSIEDNSFGTHEFLNLCELLGADAYISANVGSGTVQEMTQWIEYMTSNDELPMANWRRKNGRDKPWNVKFLGIGNESWGCGGDMSPHYYADLLRQYSLYVRRYGGRQMQRIGCGPNADDYNWTDVVMQKAHRKIDGLSVHYYTIATGDWDNKSAATNFNEDLYFGGLSESMRMDDILTKHSAIMDQHDPLKKVPIMVDEWGIWTNVEPGTEPNFLYQQNSMRDALIAAISFNTFHKHAQRVAMANIAQTVNVLQAMLLTNDKQVVKTPTYHLFNLYKGHQGATFVPSTISSEEYKLGRKSFPAITATASINGQGMVHLSLSNLHPHKALQIDVDLTEGNLSKVVAATLLSAPAYNSYNSFTSPHIVVPANFSHYSLSKGSLRVSLPAHSVVTIQLQ